MGAKPQLDLPEVATIEQMHEAEGIAWSAKVVFLVTAFPLTVALLVGIATYFVGVEAHLRYFELVAQIIPLLVLALLIEQRYFFPELTPAIPFSPIGPTQNQWKRLLAQIYEYQAFMFLVLAGGEGASLWAVATTQPSNLTFAAATAGLVGGALALVASSAKGLLMSLGEREINRIMGSMREKLEREEQIRLEVFRKFIEHANSLDGVPKAKRAEFEEKMQESVMLVRDMDARMSTEHFREEFERLAEREGRNELAPGEKLALRFMRQLESSAD